jgi:hypothetical protein
VTVYLLQKGIAVIEGQEEIGEGEVSDHQPTLAAQLRPRRHCTKHLSALYITIMTVTATD